MVKPAANGTAADVAKKPPSGIRVVHRVAAPNGAAAAPAAAPVEAKLNGLALNPRASPKAAPAGPTPDEIWARLLSEAGGDVEAAAGAVRTKLASGSLEAAAAVVPLLEYCGLPALHAQGVLPAIAAAIAEGEGRPSRAAALAACTALAASGGKPAEPALLELLPAVLAAYADKAPATRAAAAAAGEAVVAALNPHATRAVIDLCFQNLGSATRWQTRVGALNLMAARAKRCPQETGHCMLAIMPTLSEAVVDSRPEVAGAATAALLACCYAAGNRDLEPHVPALVSCIARPDEVPDVVGRLSATTFVQAMEDASLAVMVPLMNRALRERSARTQRRAAVIIENMSKLVQNPADARPFLPLLIPQLGKVAQEAADPELREVTARTRDALLRIQEADQAVQAAAGAAAGAAEVLAALREAAAPAAAPAGGVDAEPLGAALRYVAALGASVITSHLRGQRSWDNAVLPYLAPHVADEAAAAGVAAALRRWALTHMGEVVADDGDTADELCNCEFSLAYGGRILLTNATLRLRRGRRYGLCGANGAGKSTLMRAIANGQLDGFPPKEELRTVYVEHDIDSSESSTAVVDFIFQDKTIQEAVAPDRPAVAAALTSVGFSDELQASPVASLSGGWKMKLALARAMLLKADILLLDEPTNHLDTTNVAWLEHYLTSMPDVSSMVVSHDSGFLDNVCTDIIHYETRKLVLYPGNLSEFVKVKPEAKTYYELSAAAFRFKFPEPGFLDGIRGKTQSVMRMTKVGFAYPGADRKQLDNVTCRVTLGSRIAVLGRNGAGKSTLIKLLTGEMEAQEGQVWKHPNLRVAYVAQHAFHHVEQHLAKTPSEYFWWRFGQGEDEEAKEKVTRKVTDEEKARRAAAIERGERVVDYLNSRRMGKGKEYEYEVAYVGQSQRENRWFPRSTLCEEMGLSKQVEEVDARVASYRLYRALSTPLVLSHLKDFGLEEEIAAHNHIRGLSGGQKVKLVLAAAMWCQPHLLVLDEPTNYLDRDSLGALAAGINDFNGGVLMISHNSGESGVRGQAGERGGWGGAGRAGAAGGMFELRTAQRRGGGERFVRRHTHLTPSSPPCHLKPQSSRRRCAARSGRWATGRWWSSRPRACRPSPPCSRCPRCPPWPRCPRWAASPTPPPPTAWAPTGRSSTPRRWRRSSRRRRPASSTRTASPSRRPTRRQSAPSSGTRSASERRGPHSFSCFARGVGRPPAAPLPPPLPPTPARWPGAFDTAAAA
jgi:elongation factor 3